VNNLENNQPERKKLIAALEQVLVDPDFGSMRCTKFAITGMCVLILNHFNFFILKLCSN
jgi:hypothetical protein